MRLRLVTITLVAGLCALGACSNDRKGLGDAPVGPRDDSPAKIINFPDTFMNIAFKCFGVNGIYTHTRVASPTIIPNDPMCKSG